MSNLSESAIKLTPQQEQEVSRMAPEQMKEFFREEAVRQGLATRDAFSPDILIPTVQEPTAHEGAAPRPQPAGQTYKHTEVINGKSFEFEANSPLELQEQIRQAYVVAGAMTDGNGGGNGPDSGVDPSLEYATHEERFRRGEISADQFLRATGQDPESIAASEKSFENSWRKASEQWVNTPAGETWAGGERNLNVLGLMIQQLGLVDAEDKVGALTAAWTEMQRQNLVFHEPSSQIQTDHNAFREANDFESVKNLAHRASGLHDAR